jgi:uncharacterized protein
MGRTRRLPASVKEALDLFAARVRRRFGPDLLDVRAFGSYARGEATEDSDIDVLVVVREVSFARKRDVLDIAADVWMETGMQVSATVLGSDLYRTWREEERPLVMAAEREGIPL